MSATISKSHAWPTAEEFAFDCLALGQTAEDLREIVCKITDNAREDDNGNLSPGVAPVTYELLGRVAELLVEVERGIGSLKEMRAELRRAVCGLSFHAADGGAS